ncbi:radical SAM protein [Nitrospira moscoviensis]|uniref:Radical SAM domain protein n=1 Tax=Nitrospira moscoviensis TaxID=42253 RepID=A0A0K2GE80_NITMO|nr:radical SAM protein [Nitrospira moscoviensis]ALA59261.1 Radical SAM domain protein [Nitrospira moscoviensis]
MKMAQEASGPAIGIAPPAFLQIEPVGQCNLRCRMCPIQFRTDGPPYGPPAFLDFDTFARLLAQAPHVTELHLQGLGEPLMHPRFFDLVAYAAQKGIRVTTNSNLTLLTPRLAERCLASGLAYLHVSLDGATAATYEHIRVGARFDRVVRRLEALLAARRRLGLAQPGIGLVMVVMRRNLQELPAMVEQAHRWGVDDLFVQHLCHEYRETALPARYESMRAFVEAESLEDEAAGAVDRYFGEARALAARLSVRLRLPGANRAPHPPGTPGRQRCGWPWSGMYLSYRGEAMPCCMVGTPDRINFGNAAEQGAETIWRGAEYEVFRRRLESDEPPDICRSCAVYKGTM